MAETRPPLLHVGYHKTATTWLQRSVFRQEHGFRPLLSQREIFRTIIAPHDLDFSAADVAAAVAAGAPDEREAATVDSGVDSAVDVVSLENLIGNPFFGGHGSTIYADRLREVFPGARILITIREQAKIIGSTYMQFILQGGTQTPKAFFDGETVEGYRGFEPQHFRFHRLVARYQSLFGTENVMVLPLETVNADQCAAVMSLAAFSGNTSLTSWTTAPPTAVSYPETAAGWLRRINHFRNAPLNRGPMIDLGRASDQLRRAVGGAYRRFGAKDRRPVANLARARFAGYFDDSNRALAEICSHPIELRAYPGMRAD